MEDISLDRAGLPDRVRDYLYQHNIRSVSQLLTFANTERNRYLLTQGLDVDMGTLNQWLESLCREFPEATAIVGSGRRYSTGYQL